jgi:hypothetical protein
VLLSPEQENKIFILLSFRSISIYCSGCSLPCLSEGTSNSFQLVSRWADGYRSVAIAESDSKYFIAVNCRFSLARLLENKSTVMAAAAAEPFQPEQSTMQKAFYY